jgi:hypothetical protein
LLPKLGPLPQMSHEDAMRGTPSRLKRFHTEIRA